MTDTSDLLPGSPGMRRHLLAAALDLAARHLKVFPLKPGTKVPATKGWQAIATTDPVKITKLWSARDWNIGVLCGDGLVVVDLDVKDGKNGIESYRSLGQTLGNTFSVSSANGGVHLYHSGPDLKQTAGELGPGIDTRSTGGYVVGPGSRLSGGGQYVVVCDRAIEPIPPDIARRLERRNGARKSGAALEPVCELDRESAVLRAREYLQNKAKLAIEGAGGDHTTFTVAAVLKDLGISEGVAFDLMAECWNDRCSPPWDLEGLQVKVGNAYRYGENAPGSDSPEFLFAGVEIDEPKLKPRQALSRFTAASLYEHDFPPIRWIVPSILPEGATLFAGKAKLGKSWWMLDMACAVASGDFTLGQYCQEGDVLYAALEDNPRRLKARMSKLMPFGRW